ncbi:rho GTPase-activating protein 19-like isoform X1 [Mya arenaria]|uniref:rho GTPase-activating protein 19-like isoform X1 n=1 Tax=Mya arenaria TaxID=6604 RepID=UPI0022DF91D0|nr:rho GTPase-activating protein 19-like isoform X1 [Mya arenaria]
MNAEIRNLASMVQWRSSAEIMKIFLHNPRPNDMCEAEGVSRGSRPTEAERGVVRLRNVMPEKLTTFCKMHLSFLLELDGHKLEEIFHNPATTTDLDANKKKATTPFSKKKERSASPTPLSKDLVCAMSKLVEYLSRPESLKTEGIFRKTGNVSRQRLLKDWVLRGTGDFHLDDDTFSPHDVATVLKQILSETSDPLLTHRHYEAHLQIADMSKVCLSEREKKRALEKQVKSLQLLMLLLPRENAAFLETLLQLLHHTAMCPENKMSAASLGVVFAPSLVCPRKLSAEALQGVSATLSKAVTLMVENSEAIFKVPRELAADVANFWREMENPSTEILTAHADNEEDRANIQKAKYGSSSAVNTILTFAERKSPEEYACAQDTQIALAQLYAHVQSMPESAKKKKLLKQFNRAGNVQNSTKKGKHSRSRTFGESLKKHFPILTKGKSRDLSNKENDDVQWSMTPSVAIDDSVANISYLKTPDNKYTPFLRHSPAVHIIDMGASPCNVKPRKRLSDESVEAEVRAAKQPLRDVRYRPATPKKALFPNTPLTTKRPVALVSPITKTVNTLPDLTKKSIMKKGSRVPLVIVATPRQSLIESVL